MPKTNIQSTKKLEQRNPTYLISLFGELRIRNYLCLGEFCANGSTLFTGLGTFPAGFLMSSVL
jgi:hypothetical protein